MRSIFFLLSLSFFIACGVPSNPNDPQPIDPYKLSCEEAVERFTTLAKQADLSCQKDSDCVRLGSQTDCNTFCYIDGAGVYSQSNKEFTSLHNRIFENHACHGGLILKCTHHHKQFISVSKPICKEGQCSVQTDGQQDCPGPWPPPEP